MTLDEALLLNLIDLAYGAALDPQQWAVFLDRFAEAFRGSGVLFSQDMRSAEAGIAEFARFDLEYIKSYAEHYSATNLWLNTAADDPEGTLVIGRERVDARSLERSEWYNDWLAPQGLYETAGSILLKNGSTLTNLAIIRGRKPGFFDAHELTFWAKLMPHVRRAVQVHKELYAVRAQRNGALQALSGLSIGIIIASVDARILFCNETAEQILRTPAGLCASHGRLRSVTAAATQLLHRAIAGAARTGAGAGEDSGSVIALPTPSGERTCVLVSPLKAEDDVFQFHCPAALLFVADDSRRASTRADDLMRVFGVTRAEARLVCGLLDGLGLEEYADAADITIATARTQLKHVFAKTGTSRQSALIRLVLNNPVLRMAAGPSNAEGHGGKP
jgi:DNA-binding CsgD family transcriptional regulator